MNKVLQLEFELFPYVFSNHVGRNKTLIKEQYYPTEKQVASLKCLHENVTVPILKHFKCVDGYVLYINSGGRCPRINDIVRGSSTSDHLKYIAEDIELFKNGKSANEELFDYCRANLKFKQLINEKNYSWVHISYDPDNLRQQILNL